MQEKVGIVILNWNGWQDTIECLANLKKLTYDNFEVILVENGSTNDSREKLDAYIRAEKFDLHFLKLPQNFGFAEGNNRGIKVAREENCDYILLLNNDARVEPDALAKLISVSQKNMDALVCPLVYDWSGRELSFAGAKWPHWLFGVGRQHSCPPLEEWASDYLEASALLLPRSFIEKRVARDGFVFDPELFLYCEDADLCEAAKKLGHKCLVTRGAKAFHKVSVSGGGKNNRFAYYYSTRNRMFVANRWLPWPLKVIFHLYYLPTRLLLQLKRALFKCDPRILSAVFQGLRDGYLGRGGKWNQHAG